MSGQKKDDLEQLAAILKQLRKEKGYASIEKFVYAHDIPRAQYGRYENAENDIRLSSLLRIIRAHGMTPEEFFRLWKENKS